MSKLLQGGNLLSFTCSLSHGKHVFWSTGFFPDHPTKHFCKWCAPHSITNSPPLQLPGLGSPWEKKAIKRKQCNWYRRDKFEMDLKAKCHRGFICVCIRCLVLTCYSQLGHSVSKNRFVSGSRWRLSLLLSCSAEEHPEFCISHRDCLQLMERASQMLLSVNWGK